LLARAAPALAAKPILGKLLPLLPLLLLLLCCAIVLDLTIKLFRLSSLCLA
jgi:hypothetical protein